MMATTLMTPRTMALESMLLADRMALPRGQYRAWMAPEWMALSLDDASQLLWPRIKPSERIIDEDDASAACVEWQNITVKAWHVNEDKPGIHVLLNVA